MIIKMRILFLEKCSFPNILVFASNFNRALSYFRIGSNQKKEISMEVNFEFEDYYDFKTKNKIYFVIKWTQNILFYNQMDQHGFSYFQINFFSF